MLVVADTSVLVNLCRVGYDQLLQQLFREVHIPPSVHREFVDLRERHSRFARITMPSWVKLSSAVVIPNEVSACPDLDSGEAEALALALQMRADAVLIDESPARRAAVQLRVPFIGIAGILLLAKDRNLISAVRPILERLRAEANFWLAPAFEARVLRLAKETS